MPWSTPTTPSAATSFVGGPAIVWVVAMTESAAAIVSGTVGAAKELGKHGTLVIATVLQNVDLRPLPAAFPGNDPNLCAVLLVIEIEACRDPAFVEVLEWAIRKTGERDDFRLLPYLHNCSFVQFKAQLAPQHQHIANDLIDVVQISHSDDLAQVYNDLCKYLNKLEEIRNLSAWRDICNKFARGLGWVAAPFQCLSVLLALLMASSAITRTGRVVLHQQMLLVG